MQFTNEYALKDCQVIRLKNKTFTESLQAYSEIRQQLEQDETRTLYIHIFASHGVEMDGKQAVLINEHEHWFDKASVVHGKAVYSDMYHFYRRFQAEKIITNLAQTFSHSYHLGIFLCGRDDAQTDYKLYSAQEAKRISENRIRQLFGIALSEPEIESEQDCQPAQKEAHTGHDLSQISLGCYVHVQNFVFLFNERPILDNNMIQSMFNHFRKRLNAAKLYIKFPITADSIRQDDTNFRVKISPSAVALKLYHRDSAYNPRPISKKKNLVSKLIGILIVNSHCNGHIYQPGLVKNRVTGRYETLTVDEQIYATKCLFQDLKADEIRILKDRTKHEILQFFKDLQHECQQFTRLQIKGRKLVFLIRWIGQDVVNQQFSSDCNFYFCGLKYCGLTRTGKPVDVDDCCLTLAVHEHVRVVLIQDRDIFDTVEKKQITVQHEYDGITYMMGQRFSQQSRPQVIDQVLESVVREDKVPQRELEKVLDQYRRAIRASPQAEDEIVDLLELDTYFKKRKGLTRFYRFYMSAGLAQLGLSQLSFLINDAEQECFEFPLILKKTIFADNQASWMVINSFDGHFTIDNSINMRSESNPVVMNSFKQSIDLWHDRPRIIQSAKLEAPCLRKFSKNPYQLVAFLETQQIFLKVQAIDTQVHFSFYVSTYPYIQTGATYTIQVSQAHDILLVKDTRRQSERKDNHLYVSLRDARGSIKVCRFIVATNVNKDRFTDQTSIRGYRWAYLKQVCMQNEYKESSWYYFFSHAEKETLEKLIVTQRAQGDMLPLLLVINNFDMTEFSFRIDTKEFRQLDCMLLEKGYFMFLLDQRILVCDQSMSILTDSKVPFGELCCITEMEHCQYKFFVALHQQDSQSRQAKTVYHGNTEPENTRSYIVNSIFDTEKKTLSLKKSNLMILEREKICSLIDVEGRLLVLSNGGVFVIKDSQVILVVSKDYLQYQSLYVGSMNLLTGFAFLELPFVVCSDLNGLMLVNVKTGQQERLLTLDDQKMTHPINHFSVKEDYGLSLHVQISRVLGDGSMRLEWVRMPIKADVTKLLDYDGIEQLPANNIREHVVDLKELRALKDIQDQVAISESGSESRSYLAHECSLMRERIALCTGQTLKNNNKIQKLDIQFTHIVIDTLINNQKADSIRKQLPNLQQKLVEKSESLDKLEKTLTKRKSELHSLMRLLKTTVVNPESAQAAKIRALSDEFLREDSDSDYVIIDQEQEELIKRKTSLRLTLTKEHKVSKIDEYRKWLAQKGKPGFIGLDWDNRLETKRFWKLFTGQIDKKPDLRREATFESVSSLDSVRGKFRKELKLNNRANFVQEMIRSQFDQQEMNLDSEKRH